MWYHLILSDITYNQDDIILRRGDITLNRGDITSKARWYHILLINSKTAPHKTEYMSLKAREGFNFNTSLHVWLYRTTKTKIKKPKGTTILANLYNDCVLT